MMVAPTRTYEVCLADWTCVLTGLGELIGAAGALDDFRAAQRAFEENGAATQDWTTRGTSGCMLTVQFEEYESYLFGVLRGNGAAFDAGAKYLWDAYIAQGGKPEAQEQPR